MSREGAFRPVPRPRFLRVEHVPPESDVVPTAFVRVDMATGATSPPGVRFDQDGWRHGCGEIPRGWGPEPCGLGGQHRWVLEAIRLSDQHGAPGEQLVLA